MVDRTMRYFGGKWPEEVIEQTKIPIFALEALTVILGALTWGHLLKGRRVIFRSDSSNTCFAFNRLTSRHPAMQMLAEIWVECQHAFEFEALVFFCPGKHNQWADIASRPQDVPVEQALRQELDNVGLDDVDIVESETKWNERGISAEVLEELAELSEAQRTAAAI